MGIIDCKSLASSIKQKVKEEISTFKSEPSLYIFTFKLNAASSVYVQNKVKACTEAGINCVVNEFPFPVNQNDVNAFLKALYFTAWSVIPTAVIVQKPLPELIEKSHWSSLILPMMDVDGLTDDNIAKLYKKDPEAFIPATTKGVIEVLKNQHPMDYYAGKNCVVIGRSELVGKPTALVCLDQFNMTTTVCHSHTPNLREYTRNADVLISAVGKPMLVTPDMVKPGAVVLDVGISRLDGKLWGDVCTQGVSKIADVTTVPGGMGLMTVACLLQNIVQAYKSNEEEPCLI